VRPGARDAPMRPLVKRGAAGPGFRSPLDQLSGSTIARASWEVDKNWSRWLRFGVVCHEWYGNRNGLIISIWCAGRLTPRDGAGPANAAAGFGCPPSGRCTPALRQVPDRDRPTGTGRPGPPDRGRPTGTVIATESGRVRGGCPPSRSRGGPRMPPLPVRGGGAGPAPAGPRVGCGGGVLGRWPGVWAGPGSPRGRSGDALAGPARARRAGGRGVRGPYKPTHPGPGPVPAAAARRHAGPPAPSVSPVRPPRRSPYPRRPRTARARTSGRRSRRM
jgi:hypothetical protein